MLLRLLAYGLPLALFAPDALAWGLQTHVFFAQYALTLLPLADPELRAAAKRLPHLFLAGSCLPDLFIAGGAIGTPAFRRAHRWATLRRLAASPRGDEDRALALGYASHLLVDVVAHNDFVPEHEARLIHVRYATHALAEWAMDHYVAPRLPAQPGALLLEHQAAAVPFVARGFRCPEALAARAVRWLAGAERLLRASSLPLACASLVRLAERGVSRRFDAYLARSAEVLRGLEGALDGQFVDWVGSDPEGHQRDAGADRRSGEHVARIVQAQHHP